MARCLRRLIDAAKKGVKVLSLSAEPCNETMQAVRDIRACLNSIEQKTMDELQAETERLRLYPWQQPTSDKVNMVMEWQPIEIAPKDGTWILLYDQRKNVAIGGCWHVEPEMNNSNAYEPSWAWWTSDEDFVMWDDGSAPTHWMPLPKPPEVD